VVSSLWLLRTMMRFMPWKEIRTVDQRLQFLLSYQKRRCRYRTCAVSSESLGRQAIVGSTAISKQVQRGFWT